MDCIDDSNLNGFVDSNLMYLGFNVGFVVHMLFSIYNIETVLALKEYYFQY